MLVDTGNHAEGIPVQTSFHLPSLLGGFGNPPLLLERGAHKLSPVESPAPFNRDPTQQIVVIHLSQAVHYFVLKIGTLLKLLESREGSEIGWDEWKSHVIIPSIDPDCVGIHHAWVSGCRLFVLDSQDLDDRDAQVEVYDFSMQGCSEYLSNRVNSELGGLRHLSSTKVEVRFPWRLWDLARVHNSSDSMIFLCVSVTVPRSFSGNKLTYFATQLHPTTRFSDCILHIWTF